jgi:eukaryotic translation initiation factor 2C
MPGTVIDTDVMHPIEFNFILQSHAGIQGTSRPTIYHCLYDEAKFTSDTMQQLCFNLCFLSERATRSINMVSPSYRAHIAAYYARMFIDNGDDSVSVASGSVAGALKPFARGVESMMYYM